MTKLCLALVFGAAVGVAIAVAISFSITSSPWIDPNGKPVDFFKSNPRFFHGKLIIDTDCGGDDAVAILLALAHHQIDFNILAITTLTGNTFLDNVIVNVLKTQRVVKTNITVYPGAEFCILDTPTTDFYFGNDGLGDMKDSNPPKVEDADGEHAVMALIRLVHQYPGEITIVALGPLTNLAMAIRMDPTFRENVKAIIWTGGSVKGLGNTGPGIEFNAYFDPASNYIVFNTSGPPVIMCPWEMFLTSHTSLEWRQKVLGKINTPQIKFLNAAEAKAMKKSGKWDAPDSKTMSVAVNASIVTQADYVHVESIYEGQFTKGAFMVDYRHKSGRPKNAIIVHKINVDMYKNMLLDGLGQV